MAEQMCSMVEWSDGANRMLSSSSFKFLLKKSFCDCTLKTDDGKEILAHRIILASTSLFFRKKLTECPSSQIIRVPINYLNLSLIMKLIYKGDVTMAQNRLEGFLRDAKALGVCKLPTDLKITQKPRSEVERKQKRVRSKANIARNKRLAEDELQADNSKKPKLEKSDRDWSEEDKEGSGKPPDNRKRKLTTEEERNDFWDPQPSKRSKFLCQFCSKTFTDSYLLDFHESCGGCQAYCESSSSELFTDDDDY